MNGFTKLFSSIVTSTIWQEDPETKVMWITLLALANADGFVDATIPGLANIANISIDKTRQAIEKLESPDPDSRTIDYDGKRIAKVDSGWLILNYLKYRKVRDPVDRKEYMRHYMQEYRKQNVNNVNHGKPKLAHTEAEAEAEEEVEEEKPHTTTSEVIISAWQKLPLPIEKKSFGASDLLAIDRIVSELAADTQEPVHEGMILEAIENYGIALNLPKSQTYKHKLYPWLKNHVRKYVSYAFDIDHHDGSKFGKQGQTESVANQIKKLKEDGEL